MTATLQRLLIPRVFHRIWFGGPIPAREQAFGETWTRRHPGWQLRLWQEQDVPPLANQAAFDAATTPAQKAEIFRYELLLTHGGIYLDTDFECFRNIEELLGGVEVFCAREDGFQAGNGVLGCVPGHPFLAAVVAALPDGLAWRTTDPDLLTRVLVEQDALGNAVPTVFGPELFYPYHWTEPHRAGEPFPDAYAAHHWAKSWRQPAEQKPEVEAEVVPVSSRILLDVDPDLIEPGAVVLSGALEIAGGLPGVELAIVVKGAPEATQAVGDAIAGVVQQLAHGRQLPDIVVYGEPEGRSLPAAVRVELSADPVANARSLLTLALAFVPGGPPAPALAPDGAHRPGGVYVGNGRLLVRTVWGDTLYCQGDDLTVTPQLVLDGVAEPALCTFITTGWLRPGDTAVDVGAGIGALSVPAARTVGAQGTVVAYESDPAQAALLRDNATVNGCTTRLEVRSDDPAKTLNDTLLSSRARLVRLNTTESEILDDIRGWLAETRDSAVVLNACGPRTGKQWPRFAEHLASLLADGWQLATLNRSGTPTPAELTTVLESPPETLILLR